MVAWVVLLLLTVSSASRFVFHNRMDVPEPWQRVGRAHGLQRQEITIALKQQNLALLNEIFVNVSDPQNSMYGQFLSREEILDIVSPPQHQVHRVLDWLHTYGIDRVSIKVLGDAIQVRVAVSVLESMLHTQFYNFVDLKGKLIARQMGTYSIPSELGDVVEMIAGVSDFPMPRSRVDKLPLQATDSYIVPESINQIYNIDSIVASSKVSQGVIEFQNDASYSTDDLSTFFEQTDEPAAVIDHIVGPFSGQYPDTEATLDIQYITTVGLDADNWYWTEPNWMYDFSVNFFNSKEIPMVISLSWGWSEAGQCSLGNYCSTLGVDSATYVRRTNIEFQKIGLRGTSILVASGDSGANGRTDGDCSGTQLFPDFPAASPYVTSVGATQLAGSVGKLTKSPPICSSYACASSGTEVAVSYDVAAFTSGGGFSNVESRPAYQTEAVETYLKSSVELPPASYFNSTGRAYPDVAALGNNYLIYVSGSVSPCGGTSASSPTFAGIISILNTARLELGQKPIGFANPFLYQMAKEHPAAFNDVTVGDNICTEDGCSSSCKGFKAGMLILIRVLTYVAPGWDPVTGLGTPNVAEMLRYIRGKSH